MLTDSSGSGASGIENTASYSTDAARRPRSSRRTTYQRRASKRTSSAGRDGMAEIHGITIDRLTYMNTALDALPGFALREYFLPIVRLKKQLLLRQRRTRERFPAIGSVAYAKMIANAVASLAKSLSSAGGELMLDGDAAGFEVDPKRLAECLKNKITPVCMEAGSVLGYPREPPEASFVYMVLSGTVSAMYFQPQPLLTQQRRTGGGGSRKERRTYFTSAKDVVRLCGGGAVPDAALLLDDFNGTESGAAVEAASVSTVTTAIQRSLRRASRAVGQPTIQFTRIDQIRAPAVLGAAEAIGLAPLKYVSYIASAEPSGPANKNISMSSNNNNTDDVEAVHVLRVRTVEVHAALIQLAAEQQAERQAKTPYRYVPWCTAASGEAVARGGARTMADFIVSARRRTLYNDYAAIELMMRQSWLLQDAPSHTIRTLIAHMEPHTYMPGEVIACPHTPGGERQLCFLRRGRLSVYALPKASATTSAAMGGEKGSPSNSMMLRAGSAPRVTQGKCDCWLRTDSLNGAQPAEVVESGASFGELSVLFQKPRTCVLRATTACDAWCLPHRSFTVLMQRDASVREDLLQKAAVLRIEWMNEQRFTSSLAQQLRTSSELLRPLPDIAIRLIQERLEPVVYAPGALVVSTSTKCSEVIFIMHGSVSTLCKGVATYGPGDVLGEGCLVPHCWPLGLAARTMVEGWRIKANQLRDAFRRIDKLHQYSGLVTSQTTQLMKQIFGNPQPEIEVDAIGRQRMPTVEAAPGGSSYLEYARTVSDVQLKATCFLYRDYVRWEDINYSSLTSGCVVKHKATQLDTLARELAIQRLDGGKTKSVATALDELHHRQQQQQQKAVTQANPQKATTLPVATERPGGKENAEGAAETAGGRRETPAAGSGRNAVRASSSRGVNRGRILLMGGAHGPCIRVARAGAFLVKNTFLSDDATANSSDVFTSTGGGAVLRSPYIAGVREKHKASLSPRLQRMQRLLEERNRTWAAEQRHEATLVQLETKQREAAVREQVALHASTATSSQHPSSPTRGKEAIGGSRVGGALTPVSATPHFSLADVTPAPVHIFLQADKPKYELDLKDAIAIGYVMQLPDITHIQYSVSLVDPDVALGPPGQRARRHLMSITPNDRHHKHNFLFAAATLEDGGSAQSQEAIADAAAEAMVRSKARKLYLMMRSSVAARIDAEVDQVTSTPYRHASGEYNSPGNDSMDTRPPDTSVLTDELLVRSPQDDAEGLVRSPQLSHHQIPSPQCMQQQQGQSAVRSSSLSTPSPFRGAPGTSAQQRSEEAFQRMLQREPVQAIDLLRKQYGLLRSSMANTGGAGGAVASALSAPTGLGTETRSANESGFLSATPEPSGESQRQGRRPSLLDRLVMAAEGSHATSLCKLPRALPSRDCLSMDSPTSGVVVDDTDGDDFMPNGDVLLTDNTAPTFPPLMHATARDRWHSCNQLTLSSAPPGGSSADAMMTAGVDITAGKRRGEENTSASPDSPSSAPTITAALAAIPENGTLNAYFYSNIRRRQPPALFVEGYGPLQPLPEEWVEYPPAIHAPAAAGGSENAGGSTGSEDRSSAPASGSRLSRPASAMAVAASLRRSISPSRTGEGASKHFLNVPSGAFGNYTSTAAAPRMEPFIMPTLEDTEVVIRRIQRDVNGLNAVAREQRRERDLARLRNGRIVKQRAAVAAVLGKPDAQEHEFLEIWRGQFARIDRDALRRACVPAALCEEGGPDYMKRELKRLANAPVPMEDPLRRYTTDMQVWQEQREQQQHGGKNDVSTPYGTSALTGPGGATGGGGMRDGPRRVVAAVGASQLGFTPAPLQNPTAQMNAADSQAWTHQREDFFAAYKELLEHSNKPGDGAAPKLTLTAPTLRFSPTSPPAKAFPLSGKQEAGERDTVAHNTIMSYTAAFADHAMDSTMNDSNCDRETSGQPSFNSPARHSVIPAMEYSADVSLSDGKPMLPVHYEEGTPTHSYRTEEQATPSAVDYRVAVTPPQETWNADDTQDYMEGSEEESYSGEIEEEEEEEHSGVEGSPDN